MTDDERQRLASLKATQAPYGKQPTRRDMRWLIEIAEREAQRADAAEAINRTYEDLYGSPR